MHFGFFIYAAQAQFPNIIPILAIMISIAMGIVSIASLSIRMKVYKRDNESRLASKLFVKEESAKTEISILNIEKDIQEFKSDNIRDHEHIRQEIDKKLDLIIKLVS